MRRNAVIPYALIAIIGILAVIVISLIGASQRDDLANEGEDVEDHAGEVVDDPEAIYEASCATCHGGDLSGGGIGPDLTTIGADLSVDEIADIITNGVGTMPPQGHLSNEEVTIISEWLGEMQ